MAVASFGVEEIQQDRFATVSLERSGLPVEELQREIWNGRRLGDPESHCAKQQNYERDSGDL